MMFESESMALPQRRLPEPKHLISIVKSSSQLIVIVESKTNCTGAHKILHCIVATPLLSQG